MKKVILVFALALFTGVSISSCKSKEKCDAYKSSAPVKHKGAQTNA
jgi:hypothetical protein